jgi:hypothetical protein
MRLSRGDDVDCVAVSVEEGPAANCGGGSENVVVGALDARLPFARAGDRYLLFGGVLTGVNR